MGTQGWWALHVHWSQADYKHTHTLCTTHRSPYHSQVFGYPTGLGALVVRKTLLTRLRKRFAGGGTVEVALAATAFAQYVGKRFHAELYRLSDVIQGGVFVCSTRQGACTCVCVCMTTIHRLRPGPAGFEDGTLPFLAIAALRHGFAAIERLGGMDAIQQRCQAITRCV